MFKTKQADAVTLSRTYCLWPSPASQPAQAPLAMPVLNAKAMGMSDAATAELEAGMMDEYAAAMKKAGEKKDAEMKSAAAAPAEPASGAEAAAAAAQEAALAAACSESDGWSDLLGGTGSLLSRTSVEPAAGAAKAEYGGRVRVHVEGRVLALAEGEAAAEGQVPVFLSTERGINAPVCPRSSPRRPGSVSSRLLCCPRPRPDHLRALRCCGFQEATSEGLSVRIGDEDHPLVPPGLMLGVRMMASGQVSTIRCAAKYGYGTAGCNLHAQSSPHAAQCQGCF